MNTIIGTSTCPFLLWIIFDRKVFTFYKLGLFSITNLQKILYLNPLIWRSVFSHLLVYFQHQTASQLLLWNILSSLSVLLILSVHHAHPTRFNSSMLLHPSPQSKISHASLFKVFIYVTG